VIDRPTDARVAELRRAFDRSFAEPPRAEVARDHEFLAIRVAGRPFALRLADLAGVSIGPVITPLPTPVSGLLGLASFRGALVPAYDLSRFLGLAAQAEPRWLAVVAGSARLGLCFERVDGHLRVPAPTIAPGPDRPAAALPRDLLDADGTVRPIADVPAIATEIGQRARQATSERKPGP
jgi:chemotaxis signal transduction protein